jgi:transglutaminase-like putative cysteine protease
VIVRFGEEHIEQTVAGDEVAQRRVTFRSQEDQIRFLRETVRQSSELAAIRARARDIVFRIYNSPQRNEAAYAVAIGRWVQANIQYVRENPEIFQVPTATIALGYGDCDDMVTVVASLLEAVGIDSEIVGMEWETDEGTPAPWWARWVGLDGGRRAFQHIFARAVLPLRGGAWRLPLDTTLQRPMDDLTDPIKLALEMGHHLRIFVA